MLEALIIIAISALLMLLLMPRLLPRLKKMKFGQTIYELGPKHQQKQGTPNMGGILIGSISAVVMIAGVAVWVIRNGRVFFELSNPLFGLLFITLSSMAIGFADDYIKDVKKRHDGLNPKQKLVAQLVVGFVFSFYCREYVGTKILLPFTTATWDLKWAYVPVMTVAVMFMTNSANLQDGLDGLLSTVTAIGMLAFGAACFAMRNYLSESARVVILSGCAALCGSVVGFLKFNHYPAKIFMGDTGSMFIGGMMIGVGMLSTCVLPMLLFCLTSVCSSLSVMLQVMYFKATHGKRLFKMSPIHHHFELCGMKEPQIVLMYGAVTMVASILAVLCMLATIRA